MGPERSCCPSVFQCSNSARLHPTRSINTDFKSIYENICQIGGFLPYFFLGYKEGACMREEEEMGGSRAGWFLPVLSTAMGSFSLSLCCTGGRENAEPKFLTLNKLEIQQQKKMLNSLHVSSKTTFRSYLSMFHPIFSNNCSKVKLKSASTPETSLGNGIALT